MDDQPLRDAQTAAGAVCIERRGCFVASSYGDPASEYEAAADGAALVHLAERGLLRTTGPRRREFLQAMLSNDVPSAPDHGCRAAFMDARGHVQALLRVLVEKEAIALETDAARVGPLRSMLEHYRVGAPVRFDAPPDVVLAVLGPRAAEVLTIAGVSPLPSEPEAHMRIALGGQRALVARAGDLPGGGFVLHVAPEGTGAVWESLRAAGARPVGREALDAHRVETLRPWWGDDVGEENLLHETGLVAECASFTKGCYIGQETIARLDARGANVNKALRRLRLSAPATSGDEVKAEGREVGRVTTAAVSPRYGPVAMAYVHRNHFAPGTIVEVGAREASVVASFDE